MEYAVPLGILVAVLAWGVGTWVRLQRLLRAAEDAWYSWGEGTRTRNERLVDFTLRYSGFLPRGDVRPRRLRCLADDSQRILALRSMPPPDADDATNLSRMEKDLRFILLNAVETMEKIPEMQDDIELRELINDVSHALCRQDELALMYNRCVGNFNTALHAPGAQWIAAITGIRSLKKI